MPAKKYADQGLTLKAMRLNLSLSQEQFAKSIGLETQVLQNLEQGITSCSNLKYATLKAIAYGLTETPDTLIQKLTN